MYGIFALVGLVGMAASSFLPESLGQDFPESVEDILRRPKHPYFSWRVWKKVEKEEDGKEELEALNIEN